MRRRGQLLFCIGEVIKRRAEPRKRRPAASAVGSQGAGTSVFLVTLCGYRIVTGGL